MEEPSDTEIRYKSLFDLAADAILTGDTEGLIDGGNRKAEELSGYSIDELIGHRINFLFSAEEQERVPVRYDLVMAGKEIQTERYLTRKDGSTVPVSMNSKMMPDGTYHSTIRDITKQKILEEKLWETNRELKAFAYTVSHDLRTPLTAIIGFTEYLLNHGSETLGPQTRELLEKVEQAGEGMHASLEALLELATAGNRERPNDPVELNQVVANIIGELNLPMTKAGLTVSAEKLPSLHVPETFLSQIFSNLISNAIHYAGRASGPVEIGGDRTENLVRFYVRDYGPGIPLSDRERIFEVFFRGSENGETKGTGVGLAIVQKIARAYGGRAWQEETPGGGCTIWVEMEDI